MFLTVSQTPCYTWFHAACLKPACLRCSRRPRGAGVCRHGAKLMWVVKRNMYHARSTPRMLAQAFKVRVEYWTARCTETENPKAPVEPERDSLCDSLYSVRASRPPVLCPRTPGAVLQPSSACRTRLRSYRTRPSGWHQTTTHARNFVNAPRHYDMARSVKRELDGRTCLGQQCLPGTSAIYILTAAVRVCIASALRPQAYSTGSKRQRGDSTGLRRACTSISGASVRRTHRQR